MNCAVHSNREVIAACRCCGSLTCESCDVVCAGRHFCKKCVTAGEAVTLRGRFRRIRPTDRAPILLGVDWVLKRWPALLMMLIGTVTLSSALICMTMTGDAASHFIAHVSANNFGTSYTSWSGMPISRMALSIWMQAGAFLLVGSLLMLVRRFGLRWLMLAVLIVGLTGAAPFMLLHSEPHLTQCISVVSPTRMQKRDANLLQSLVEPNAAMKSMPLAMLDELKLKAGEGVSRVTTELQEGGHEIVFNIEYRENLDERQRATLEDFYQEYATTLALEKGDPTKVLPTGPNVMAPPTGESIWGKYEAQWKSQRTPLNTVAAH